LLLGSVVHCLPVSNATEGVSSFPDDLSKTSETTLSQLLDDLYTPSQTRPYETSQTSDSQSTPTNEAPGTTYQIVKGGIEGTINGVAGLFQGGALRKAEEMHKEELADLRNEQAEVLADVQYQQREVLGERLKDSEYIPSSQS
jgi:hypothetical protein